MDECLNGEQKCFYVWFWVFIKRVWDGLPKIEITGWDHDCELKIVGFFVRNLKFLGDFLPYILLYSYLYIYIYIL